MHHEPTALDEVYQAFKNGLSGNFVSVASSSNQQVVLAAVGTPDEAAQCWQVTLLAMQMAVAPAIPAPAANIDSLKQRNEVQSLIGGTSPRVCVQYGTGNSLETAFVDVPFGGCTFELRASHVRVMVQTVVQFVGTSALGIPYVGAFISPGSSRSKSRMPPTFTTAFQTVTATGGTFTFCAPERAVGYRVLMADDVTTSSVTVQEGTYAGAAQVTVFHNANMLRAPQGVMPADNWIALRPASTAVILTNNEGTNRSLAVMWILDLG